MFQQGIISAYEIECDLAERNRTDATVDEHSWVQATTAFELSWMKRATRQAGQTLIKLGRRLENYSLNTTPAMSK
jgi:hypothetical protein